MVEGSVFLAPFEGRVGVEVATEMTGEQEGLRVKEQADWNFFAEKGVVDFLLFAFLPPREDFLATIVGEQDCAGFKCAEVLGANLLPVY